MDLVNSLLQRKLVNLSIAFAWVPHDLASAKLNAYWFILKTILN